MQSFIHEKTLLCFFALRDEELNDKGNKKRCVVNQRGERDAQGRAPVCQDSHHRSCTRQQTIHTRALLCLGRWKNNITFPNSSIRDL